MALLVGLLRLGYHQLVVCHFNHGLRPADAEREARLVRSAAGEMPVEEGWGDVASHARESGLSIEIAARELRLRFFEACSKAHRCRRVLLAHHAGDQVETILLNLFRGTGLAGLCGMRPVSRVGGLDLLRPMLGIARAEVRFFVESEGIAFSEDPSNQSPAHARNRVRHELIPLVQSIFGEAAPSVVLRMARMLADEEAFISENVPALPREIPLGQLTGLHPALRARAVLEWLRRSGVPEPGARETMAVLSLLDIAGGPAKVNLPGGLHARRRAGQIFLEGIDCG
ncbi:MAG: hypothetical protein Fur0032_16140 [Terrimicrobiaceae bacterium]